ncbi:MAG: NAD(P)-binding protein [Pseudomonadota bacterium]
MSEIAILGTGMGAVGAAHRLQGEKAGCVLYDRNTYAGGHTVTFHHPDGFSFDSGPHVSFTSDERFRKLLADAVKDQYEAVQYKLNNYWQGYWFPHPVQCNLYGLPPALVTKILLSFVEEHQKAIPEIKNYEEWLVASYGRELAQTFPMAYTAKYHTTPSKNLRTDWMGPRMYRPSLEEVVFGAVSPTVPNHHYITNFRYPSKGGFQSYVDGLRTDAKIVLDHEVVQIDPAKKELGFKNGKRLKYDAVVSSIALPDLIPMIVGVPAEVRAAAATLACSSAVLVNIGVDRADISQAHISYFYDDDVIFSRLSFPHMFAASMAPAGCGSIQAEVYFSKKYKPIDRTPESCIEPVIADLRRVGLLRESDRILHKSVAFAEYANIIFDHDRPAALATVHGYLDQVGIAYCGRYGEWAYYWTDDSFKSGERAAEKALSRL